MFILKIQMIIVAVQSLSCVHLFGTLWTVAHEASLSFTISWSLLKLLSIELVMPSNHLILCHPLLPLLSIFSSIRVFSDLIRVLSEPVSWLFASDGQSIGASTSVLRMNIQDWLPLGLTSLSSRRRQWQPTPVLLPRKSHGWRSLVGCSPWGRYQSAATERLHFHFSLSRNGEGNGNPLQCSCLENPRNGRAWWTAVYGVTQSQTGLKRLSSSSSLISVMFKKLSRIFFRTNNDNFVSFLLILCIYLSCLIDWAGFPVLLWMVLVIVETWTYSFFFFLTHSWF